MSLHSVEEAGGGGALIGSGVTDADGRLRGLVSGNRSLPPGTYRLRFDVGSYFAASGRETLYPVVEIVFRVTAGAEHYHIPLLLSPFGYSTYRGS